MEQSMFTQFDVVVCVIILLSTVVCFISGALKAFLTMFGYVISAVATLMFYPAVSTIAEEHFAGSGMMQIVSVTGLFLACVIAVAIINAILLSSMKEARLGAVDRSLGMLLGMLIGIAIASGIHLGVTKIAGDIPDWLRQGETYRLTNTGASLLSDWFGDTFEEGEDDITIEDLPDSLLDEEFSFSTEYGQPEYGESP